jgi:hypothetical protein
MKSLIFRGKSLDELKDELDSFIERNGSPKNILMPPESFKWYFEQFGLDPDTYIGNLTYKGYFVEMV